MNSLKRMLRILDLYGAATPVLEAEVIAESLGYATATSYRYIKALCEAGLLIRRIDGYALGPRFILMDRQIRDYDPLLLACQEIFKGLVEQTGLDVLVNQLYGEQVLSIHQESGQSSFPMLYGRGKTMDMFRSSSAQIITAHLQTRHLRRLYEKNQQCVFAGRLGKIWAQFSETMQGLRRQGYCLTKEQISQNKAGISAPIFDEKQYIFGSVTLVGKLDEFHRLEETELAEVIKKAGLEISQRLVHATVIHQENTAAV